MSGYGAAYNLPPGCSPNDPHFNPEEPHACIECGETELFGGEECEACGEYQPTIEEAREDAEYDAAEARYDF